MRPSLKIWPRDDGQTIVEYAMTLGIILVLALGMVRLFETNALQTLIQIAKSLG